MSSVGLGRDLREVVGIAHELGEVAADGLGLEHGGRHVGRHARVAVDGTGGALDLQNTLALVVAERAEDARIDRVAADRNLAPALHGHRSNSCSSWDAVLAYEHSTLTWDDGQGFDPKKPKNRSLGPPPGADGRQASGEGAPRAANRRDSLFLHP